MQRLFRIERAKLSARSLRFASELSILRSNLTLLDSSVSSIFAVPDLGEEFFDYNTQLEGGISPVATGFAEDKVTYLKDLINNLAHEGKISSQCAEDACYFLDYGQHYVKVGGNVVLIPYETIEEQAQIAKRLENASAPSHKSRWWLWLLPVIAALGLFALWYFISNQDKSQDPKTLGDKQEQALEQGTTSSKPNQEGSEDPENLNVKADELPGKGADLTATLDKGEPLGEKKAEFEGEISGDPIEKAGNLEGEIPGDLVEGAGDLEEEAQIAVPVIKPPLEEEEAQVMVPVIEAQEEQIAVPVIAAPSNNQDALLEAQKAEQEALAKVQEAKTPAPESKAEAPDKPSKPKESKAQNKPQKKLPKCSTLRKEQKLPGLIMAIDGSASMRTVDVRSDMGRLSRLEAAQNSAVETVKLLDKNVSVGLVEINRCPTALKRGFFSGDERHALIGNILNVGPKGNGTALISGLYAMAELASTKGESLGILLSDGLDTCAGLHGPDVCDVARDIHSKLPNFKINVVLIGKDANKLRCVAQITQGKVYTPRTALEFSESLKAAGAPLNEVCEE